jgi:hypothetical protein
MDMIIYLQVPRFHSFRVLDRYSHCKTSNVISVLLLFYINCANLHQPKCDFKIRITTTTNKSYNSICNRAAQQVNGDCYVTQHYCKNTPAPMVENNFILYCDEPVLMMK